MDRVIRPAKRVRGAVRVPGDKSISHRALILGALAPGRTYVRGLAPGLDVLSTKRCLEGLGVRFTAGTTALRPGEDLAPGDVDVVVVHGVGHDRLVAPDKPLDCGNSGTTARLLSGVLAGADMTATLTGDASLRRRPMGRVAEPLRKMGARIEPAGGAPAVEGKLTLPLKISGSARPRPATIELAVASAQVKSAILLAGLRAAGRTVVREPSRSRDHTERMLRVFGVDVLEEGTSVTIDGPVDLDEAAIDVPADPSSAAFFIAAAAGLPGSRVLLRDVGVNPGRTGFFEIARDMGVKIFEGEERDSGFEPVAEVVADGPPSLRATRVSGEVVPRAIDELVVLAVLATRAEGTTEIRDAAELRVKESDRIALIAENLRRMGAEVEALPDGLRIPGPVKLRGAEIDTAGDHRIAMAFAVAGLWAEGETLIKDAECADVSFPGFYEVLESICER